MSTRHLTSLRILILVFTLSFSQSFKAEKDPLHKRVFNTTISETKEGSAPVKKPVTDKVSFKDGKIFSDFLYDKFQYKWLKYRINKDSIFTDSTDTEVRLLEVEATTTDEANQTVNISFSVQEWDIEGTIRITKNDKLKKAFDFSGREKGGKPKKVKKKKKKVVEILDENGQPRKE